MLALEFVGIRADTSDVSSFGNVSPQHASLASMDLRWLPNKPRSILVFVAASALLVWGSALGGRSWGPVRAVLRWLPYGDKVGHFGLYGAITFAAAMLVRTRLQAVAVGVGVIALGIADEFRQLLEPHRNFSISDVLANLGGVCLGLLAVLAVMRFTSTRSVDVK